MKSALVLLFAIIVGSTFTATGNAAEPSVGPQSPIDQSITSKPHQYPRIVLYSVSWCPHCREAKEYLTSHNIPFINRDVELDDSALEELTKKYKSEGVPVIVIGNDEKIMRGFDKANFEKILQEFQSKK